MTPGGVLGQCGTGEVEEISDRKENASHACRAKAVSEMVDRRAWIGLMKMER